MSLDRRHFLSFTAGTAAGVTDPFATQRAVAAPLSILGVDALHFGVRAGVPEDQSRALQSAIDRRRARACRSCSRRASTAPATSGCRAAGRCRRARGDPPRPDDGPPLVAATRADNIRLAGLILDGAGLPMPENRGLVHFATARAVRITDCESSPQPQRHRARAGRGRGDRHDSRRADAAIFSRSTRAGLTIARNTIRVPATTASRCGARSRATTARWYRQPHRGARAGRRLRPERQRHQRIPRANVMVQGNRIRGCAFSAVRGNAASNLQMIANNCTGSARSRSMRSSASKVR